MSNWLERLSYWWEDNGKVYLGFVAICWVLWAIAGMQYDSAVERCDADFDDEVDIYWCVDHRMESKEPRGR